MTTVNALNTITGLTARLPKRIVDHAVLGEYLVEVSDDAKPYASDLFKSTTPDEFEKTPRRGRKKKADEDTDETTTEGATAFGAQIDEDN